MHTPIASPPLGRPGPPWARVRRSTGGGGDGEGEKARAGAADRAALRDYAASFGQAFQLADDLLDAQGDATALGKAVAKDAGRGKATLVALLGVDAAKAKLAALVAEAENALAPFGDKATKLARAARFIAERRA